RRYARALRGDTGAAEFDRCPSTAGAGAAPVGAGAASRPVRAPCLPTSPLCRRRRRCSNEGLRRGGMGVLVSSHAHAPPEPESSPERARRAVADTATAGAAAVDAVTSGTPAREAGRAGVAGAHGAAPAATTTAHPAAPAGVLLLQRLAGNRATAALLHARVGPASHGPAASRVPVVQRSPGLYDEDGLDLQVSLHGTSVTWFFPPERLSEDLRLFLGE